MRRPHGNTRWTPEDRAKARRFFVEEGKTPDPISEAIGCSARTIQIWIKEGHWREARESWLQVHGIPIEDLEERALRKLLGRLDAEADHMPTKDLLDLLSNVNKFKVLIAKRQGYRLVDAALVVGEEFQAFVLRECPEEAPGLLEAWKGFLDDLQRRNA
jgi:hypothetical protein